MAGHSMAIGAVLHHDQYEPPAKRLKTNLSRGGTNIIARSPLISFPQHNIGNWGSHGVVNGSPTPTTSKAANGTAQSKTSQSKTPTAFSLIRSPRAVITSTDPSAPRSFRLPRPYVSAAEAARPAARSPDLSPTRFNTSPPPTDPRQLINWLAQLATSLGRGQSSEKVLDDIPQSPTQLDMPSNSNAGAPKASDSVKIREENRERKKRWRANNAERS